MAGLDRKWLMKNDFQRINSLKGDYINVDATVTEPISKHLIGTGQIFETLPTESGQSPDLRRTELIADFFLPKHIHPLQGPNLPERQGNLCAHRDDTGIDETAEGLPIQALCLQFGGQTLQS